MYLCPNYFNYSFHYFVICGSNLQLLSVHLISYYNLYSSLEYHFHNIYFCFMFLQNYPCIHDSLLYITVGLTVFFITPVFTFWIPILPQNTLFIALYVFPTFPILSSTCLLILQFSSIFLQTFDALYLYVQSTEPISL